MKIAFAAISKRDFKSFEKRKRKGKEEIRSFDTFS